MEKNTEAFELYSLKRALYLRGEETHQEFYLWLADFIGATAKDLPVTVERIKVSTDWHLNDIGLGIWDSCDPAIRYLAYQKGLAWSLSDTVCVLKALARKEAFSK